MIMVALVVLNISTFVLEWSFFVTKFPIYHFYFSYLFWHKSNYLFYLIYLFIYLNNLYSLLHFYNLQLQRKELFAAAHLAVFWIKTPIRGHWLVSWLMTLNDLCFAVFDLMRSIEGFHFEFGQRRPLNDRHHV